MNSRLRRLHPDQLPDLHRRAAQWYEQNNLFSEAIEHALSAGDFQFAAKIAESNALGLLNNGNISTLLGWFNNLPDEIIKEYPRLCVYCVWALMLAGKTDNVEKYLLPAEAHVSTLEDFGGLRGDIAAVRAYAAARQ